MDQGAIVVSVSGPRAGDGLSRKGVLYARIKLPLGHLNIFTTHTQASYVEGTIEAELPSYIMRLKHLVSAKRFIYKTLDRMAGTTDSNLFVGDLNVNATAKNYPIQAVISQFKDNLHGLPDFKPVNNNEYDLLMYIFNHSQNQYYLRDTLYEEHNVFKVTYGDVVMDQGDGESPAVL